MIDSAVRHEIAPTNCVDIYIAGSLERAKQVCREYCMERGLCVTVTPTTYVYSGGEEEGVRIGLINYPRFPKEESEIYDIAKDLGTRLMVLLCQTSFSIVTPAWTHWWSRRKEDA